LAVVAGLLAAAVAVWLILRDPADREFLLKLFLVALAVRWVTGFLIAQYKLQAFFGADAPTYDYFGNALSRSWQGLLLWKDPWLMSFTSIERSGWGMYYYVAAVYYVLGQNPLAIQFINGVIGAFACVVAYRIAALIYPTQSVARATALLTALAPSLILWSSQLLKDGLIVLFLCLCTYYALKLRDGFHNRNFLFLLVSLFCLFSLRHYAAYIIFFAIAGSLIFSARKLSPIRVLQGAALVLVIGITFVYLGAGKAAEDVFDLQYIQSARVWSAEVSGSGYGGNVDIRDPRAALWFLPIGLLYVLFAPFPWQITNMRQLITLPEVLIWWALVPMLVSGYWFVIRRRLKESFAVCVFTAGLALAYALYQTNVGTAFRHRAQLYVFFFIFISVGLELRRAARIKKRSKPLIEQPNLTVLSPAVTEQSAGN
jgi:hypothetical protein